MSDINVTIETANPINVTIETANPINVTVGGAVFRNWVVEDQKFFFNGLNGDTYFIYDSGTSSLQLFVNGVKQESWN